MLFFLRLNIFICFMFFGGYACAIMPVVDAEAIAQLAEEYEQLIKLYNAATHSNALLESLQTAEVIKWESYQFIQYQKDLESLSADMESAQKIVSDLEKFNNLYPGYDSNSVNSKSSDFRTRNTALLNLLAIQINVANDALANQKNINTANKSSTAAVANLTLASLANLNSQISAEIRAANSYRASETQNKVDAQIEQQKFIGDPYKSHSNSEINTWIGEK